VFCSANPKVKDALFLKGFNLLWHLSNVFSVGGLETS